VGLAPGTEVMILKIFLPKKFKKSAFLTQTKANFLKKLILTLVFEKKNANFFAENWQKSQKTVILVG
jgi:hypothetical protein